MNNVQENTTHSNNLHLIFNCVILVCDPHSSVSCLYLLNLGTVLIFVNYVSCCQATGTYCIGNCDWFFSFMYICIFMYFKCLFSCLYFNYFNAFFFYIIFLYIKIHPSTVQRNAYILNIWLFYTMSAAYSSVCFGFMLYYFDSLMMVLCGQRHVGLLSMILYRVAQKERMFFK